MTFYPIKIPSLRAVPCAVWARAHAHFVNRSTNIGCRDKIALNNRFIGPSRTRMPHTGVTINQNSYEIFCDSIDFNEEWNKRQQTTWNTTTTR